MSLQESSVNIRSEAEYTVSGVAGTVKNPTFKVPFIRNNQDFGTSHLCQAPYDEWLDSVADVPYVCIRPSSAIRSCLNLLQTTRFALPW